MTDHFMDLESELSTLKKLATGLGPSAFFAQEALRFVSMAGTMRATFTLKNDASVDERHITHTLSRSLLENYFWILYIFDDETKRVDRYQELIDSFKSSYRKLHNEKMLPHKDKLESADPLWASLPRALDVNSMLAQIKNDGGERLDYLYFITSVPLTSW